MTGRRLAPAGLRFPGTYCTMRVFGDRFARDGTSLSASQTTNFSVPVSRRLPVDFSSSFETMRAEAEALSADCWQNHFNADYHDGGWQGASLRAVGGDAARLYIDPESQTSIVDTPLMARCPAIAAALAQFSCPLRAVRLLRLLPGSVIREHRDYDLRFEDGAARLHIPLTTNPAVEFYVDQQRVIMAAGECWYLNLSLPHRVANRGDTARVHLVIDCEAGDWLRDLIAMGDAPERASTVDSGLERFERFRQIVFADRELQARLAAIADPEAFADAVLEAARARGHDIEREEIAAAMRRGRRSGNVASSF